MRKSLSITLIIVMLCSIVLQFGNTVHAAEVPGNVITKAWVTDADGNAFKEGAMIGPWQPFRVYAEYKLPDNTVKAGDTTTMTLPIGFRTSPPENFEIKDGDNIIAKGTLYNEKPGKIVLTYTKYAEEHSGVHGSFYFNINVNGDEQSESGKIPVTLTVNGKVIPAGEVNFKKPHWKNQMLRKGGWMLNDKTRGKYDIRVNESNDILVNAKLVDTLESPGVEYVEDSIKVLQGKWKNLGSTEVLQPEKDVTAKFMSENRIKFEGNRLTIDIGNLPEEVETRGFQILYEVKLKYEPIVGEEIHNKVDLTTGGGDFHETSFYKIREAGGVGEGYVYKIRVKKTGKDGAALAGAEFDVIRVRNNQKVGTIKSGSDGKCEIGKLLRDTYKLVETKAPEGYIPLTEPITITPADFGTNKIAERTIENKENPKINICGEKTWDDANNQDKKRPNKITVILHANGKPIQNPDVRPDENGKWKYSFTDLPKYDNKGEEITYTVKEEPVKGYTSKVEGYNITNSYKPEETSVTVTKRWDDANNQDGKRPNSIKVQLYGNDEKVGGEVELTDGNWTHTWNDLPEKKAGKTIKYTVKEVGTVAGYTTSYSDENHCNIVICNKHTPEKTKVEGEKTWNDANDQDGKRPTSITVNLLANGKKVAEKTVTKDDNWKYSFTDLPKYEGGQEIKYTVTENAVPEYNNEVTGYNIKNSYTPKKTSVTVTKRWDDANNQDGKRPDTIKVQLYGDNEKVEGEVELKKTTGWTHTWNDLPEKKAGKTIKYTVKEVGTVEGYETSYNNDNHGNIIICNKHVPEKTKVEGKKTWDDAEDQDGKRPEEITINLLKNGAKFKSVTVKPDADGNWKYEFTNLDKYENGKEIKYTVTEDTVKDYNFSSEGYNIKNSYTPKETSVTVTKRWNDSNDKDKLRPESIKVQLYANGEKKGEAVELKADSNWSYTWNNLPEKAKGKDIKYTVKEVDKLKGYTVSVDDKDHGNIIITNTHTPKEITHPKTGDINKLIPYAMMLFASLIGLMGMIVSRRRVAN
ncbi:Cna protein B-type domain protein [Mogibacterium timidum ATCC 33093]|uniref:Cna protein B-type domain protein n=2 Tax=Mogibacterium timidum TaxID=35519 RepID=X8IPD5_9FIRM|nr:Cna protein B-type domain protein [Mogibacterium timidum ATCC 33093]